MKIVGINLFEPIFPIDDYYNKRCLRIVNFIKTYTYCIWSAAHFRIGNDLFYSIILIKVIDLLLKEFSVPHSYFISPMENCIILDDQKLMIMIIPSEEIFALFSESKFRLTYPKADFNRIYD